MTATSDADASARTHRPRPPAARVAPASPSTATAATAVGAVVVGQTVTARPACRASQAWPISRWNWPYTAIRPTTAASPAHFSQALRSVNQAATASSEVSPPTTNPASRWVCSSRNPALSSRHSWPFTTRYHGSVGHTRSDMPTRNEVTSQPRVSSTAVAATDATASARTLPVGASGAGGGGV
jgi:hypothetical protein